jgi:hypothetical protein
MPEARWCQKALGYRPRAQALPSIWLTYVGCERVTDGDRTRDLL